MSVISRLKEKVTEHVDVYVRLFKLNFIARTANVLSYFLFLLIGLFVVFCILLFTGFGLVEMFIMLGLTKLAGFALTILIYMMILLIIMGLRKKLTRFFASGIIRELTRGDDDDDKEEKE